MLRGRLPKKCRLFIHWPCYLPDLEPAVAGVPSTPKVVVLASQNTLIARHLDIRDHDFQEVELRALLDNNN